MTDEHYVKPKKWEGKPFSFKFKYFVGNFPEMALVTGLFIVSPIIIAISHHFYPGSRADAISKFKGKYTVVRHDDPKIDFIKWQKENGRHHFPQY